VGEPVDRDQEHLNLLKLSFYIMAGVIGFSSLFSTSRWEDSSHRQ